MKTHIMVGLAVLAGIGIGVGGIEALHAQAKPPVYVIEEIELTNADAYAKEYLPLARPTVKAHGGRVIAAGTPIDIEGQHQNRGAVVVFDSLDQIKSWHNSAEYQEARKVGNKYAKFRSFAVEGIPQ